MTSQMRSTRRVRKTTRKEDQLLSLRNMRLAKSETTDIIRDFLQSLDCPRSLAIWLMYQSNEHDQITELDCNSEHYLYVSDFSDAYIATGFLSKAKFLNTSFDRDERALAKFKTYEAQCALTNRRFVGKFWIENPKLAGLVFRAQRKISQILGTFDGEEMVGGANWGKGTTVDLKSLQTHSIPKFQHEAGITRDLHSWVSEWFPLAYPTWWESISEDVQSNLRRERFSLRYGNEVITVPKNSKINRVIAVEPGINLWFQKGCGSMIRRRLGRIGVNLNSQLRNQHLARVGSLSDQLATVDFSSASDSIALELVRVLLPDRWFQVLDLVRSKCGKFNAEDSAFWWSKFSSMGNGFTFELESLIFYALASVVCEDLKVNGIDISVYGDDVILPTSAYELFSALSTFCGFTVNKTKSFSSGPFRESCGAHWYAGTNCKPIFLKERVRDAQNVFGLANNIRVLAHRLVSFLGCDSRFRGCWHRLLSRVPESIRFRVSLDLGDVGFICNFDEACPQRAPRGFEGFHVWHLSVRSITVQSEHRAVTLSRLWQPSVQEDNNTYPLRGRTRLGVSQSLVPRWYHLGPWV